MTASPAAAPPRNPLGAVVCTVSTTGKELWRKSYWTKEEAVALEAQCRNDGGEPSAIPRTD